MNYRISGIAAALIAGYIIGITATPAYAQTAVVAAAEKPGLAADLERFIAWFGGEWNNNEQVWQQKVDAEKLPGGKPDDPISHTHHIFAPVAAPKIGEHTYYVQQHLDADMSKAYRQRLYRISRDDSENAIKLEIFSFPDDKAFFNAHLKPDLFRDLEPSALKAAPGCEVYWRYTLATKEFTGTMKPGACSYFSKALNKRVVISDTLKLSESEIWINDQARDEQGGYIFGSKTGTPVKNRKVRYYTGWMYMKRAGKDAKETDTNGSYRGDLVIHNEGQYQPLLWDDGTPTQYLVQLAQLTYQNTRAPILKLALFDKDTKKSLFYIWANIEATRIGLNLGWVQVGLKQKESRVAYGFGDAPKAASASTAK